MTTIDSLQTQINSVISLYSNGQIQEALDSVEALIRDYPKEALLYNISGVCYKASGQLDAAVESFEKALAIKPDYAEVNYNLGLTLQELERLDAAVKCYEKAIAIQPDYAEAHNNLGVTLKELDQLDAAVECYEKALAIKPDYAEAHNNLGLTLQKLDQVDAAVESYKKALAVDPDYAEVNYNLGLALQELDQVDAAVESYKKAVAIQPDYAEAHNNLGNSFLELSQLDDAVKSYEKAIATQPDYVEAHNNLGNIFMELGQMDDAVKSYEKALALKPNDADAYNKLGIVYMELDQTDVALKCYKKALALNPDNAKAHANRGDAMKRLERMDEALASYESAIALNPNLDYVFNDYLHTRINLCIWDDLASHLNELTSKVNNGEKALNPFIALELIDDPEIQRKAAEIYANKEYPQSHVLPKIERYPKHKKIRIGYFSQDFVEHPVSYLTAELYEMHDRKRFEIHAFSFGPDTEDEMTLRIKKGVDHFHDVRKMLHKDTAMLARSLEIDIAVDLGGYTHNSRTGIFAMSAAPIQISYIGYPGTMGAKYYDYLVADETLIPEKNQKYYTEKIAYLPSYQVNDSKQSLPETVFSRQDLGLPKAGFVFCCFSNTFKLTPATFDGWGRILKQVDNSVLLIYANNETAKINLTKEIVLRGIQPSRLIFAEQLPKLEYLARYRLADLFLDTLPYNAGTTASDALRMGLPVLTCMGSSFVSREAASVINAINLPELITSTQEQYESVAIELATDTEKLKIIKDKLASNLATAPLYDTPLFTRHLESAYLTMYDRYQQGLDPEHIYVEH